MALSVRPLFDELLFCAFVSARFCKFSKDPQSVMSGKTYFQPIEAAGLPGRDRPFLTVVLLIAISENLKDWNDL